MVFRVCLKFSGDRSTAEDLAQDALLRAYSAIGDFREDAAFSTWLYQIVLRRCLDWRRQQARLAARVIPGEIDANWPAADLTPEDVLQRRETEREVRAWVEQLRDPYRSMVELFYYEHLTYDEISAHTGIPVKTVESQLYRARRKLRQIGGAR